MSQATLRLIDYHFPTAILDNKALESRFPGFTAEKIAAKTGIDERHIAAESECASDLALQAAMKVLARDPKAREHVDAVILCTQTPDYFLPATACLLQDRLKLSRDVAAFDINQGCSGYIYGLGLAKGLIETGQAKCVLLLTADTYSKLLAENDRGVRSLFGDAATASIVEASEDTRLMIGPFVYGTDGRGADHLRVDSGAFRKRCGDAPPRLVMNGPEIFNFTIDTVPNLVNQLFERSRLNLGDIDLFVFHQANAFMLHHLRRKLNIPEDRFVVDMARCGNTVSSTIPIALRRAEKQGRLQDGMRLMLVGFGVGLSWAGALITWQKSSSVIGA